MAEGGEDARRRTAVTDYRKKLLTCRELEARVKTGTTPPPTAASSSARLPCAWLSWWVSGVRCRGSGER
jgi:hypothetical protein